MMTQNANQGAWFVDFMTKLVLESETIYPMDDFLKESFPLKVKVDPLNSSTDQSPQELKNHLTTNNYSWKPTHELIEVSLSSLEESERLIEYLADKNWTFLFDYSAFSKHPGLLLAKPIKRSETTEKELKEFFNSNSRFKSLADVSFVQIMQESKSDIAAAVLKFDNFMDANYILESQPILPNPFNSDIPLQLSRFKKRKEKAKLQLESIVPDVGTPSLGPIQDDSTEYDTIIIENFSEFLGGSANLETIEKIITKIQLFHSVERVFLPATKSASGNFTFRRFGYIKLAHTKDLMSDALNCLYYLNDLTLQNLLEFSTENIYDIKEDVNKPQRLRKGTKSATFKLAIAQRKHNHYVFQSRDFSFLKLSDSGNLVYSESLSDDLAFENDIAKQFTKATNYQETNVYVNNFPVLFENNDELWAEFWNQFGVDSIKSARIIKPQFYSKKTDGPLGKIGFVFYEDFRMALRAIILTNNKIVSFKDHPNVLVQTSFAIQKDGNSMSTGKAALPKYSMNPPPNHNFLPPNENTFDRRVGYPLINDSYFYMEPPFSRNGSPSHSPQFFNAGENFMYNPYMVPLPYAPVNVEEDASPRRESMVPHNNSMGISPNQFTAPMGYYYSYYPFSSPVHINSIPSVPINGNLVPMHPNSPYNTHLLSNRNKERRNEGKESMGK